MIVIGQLVRDRSRSTLKIAIVLQQSRSAGKLRICHWQASGDRWSPPTTAPITQLEAFPADLDLTTRSGLVIAAARRSVSHGTVRWLIGAGCYDRAHVGRVTL